MTRTPAHSEPDTVFELPTESEPVKVVCGDCVEEMRKLPDACVDLVITSPPYNLGNTSGGGFPQLGHYTPGAPLAKRGGQGKWKRASAAGGLGHGYNSHDDAMPHEEYVAWQKECLTEMWRVIKPTGAIYYNHKSRIFSGHLVTPLDYNPGLPVRQIVIWARAGGINFAPTHYVPTHEWVVVFAKDAFRLKSKGASGVGDVWNIPQEPNPDHPAPFPLSLPRRILETTGAKVVLDPFAGSGTVGVAALHEERQAILIEQDPAYCEIIRRRVADAQGVGKGSLLVGWTQPDLFA